MPHQQNPERGPDQPRSHGHRTATPDAPHLPRQRHETPSRPPANATPPGGRPATAPRPTPPSGNPVGGRPAPRPTRMMPGPGTPDTANARPTDIVSPPVSGPPGSGGGRGGNGAAGSGGSGSGDGGETTKTKSSDLQFNKIVAGAGAAVVTAVLGSFLGAVGTIIGAALGSIITTVATTFFQKSIETTRAQVSNQGQKLRDRRSARQPGNAAWQAAAADGGTGVAGPDGQETVRIDPSAVGATQVAPSSSGSRWHWRLRKMTRKQVLFSVLGAVLAFGLAMFLITGIEWVKGSTITGGNSGTSIGNVANSSATQQQNTDDQNSDTGTSTSESTTSTSDPSSDQSDQSTGTSQNDGNSDNGNSSSSTATSNPLGGLNNIIPTQGNDSGQRQSAPANGNSGGGANSSN